MWLLAQQMNSYPGNVVHPEVAVMPLAWFLLIGLAVAIPTVVAVYYLVSKRLSPAAGFGLGAGLLVLIVMAYLFTGTSLRQEATLATVDESRSGNPMREVAAAPVVSSPDRAEASPAPPGPSPLKPSPAEKPEPPIVKTSSPAWMSKPEGLSTDEFGRRVYRRIVHTDPWATRGECERDLAPRLNTAVTEYLIRKFGEHARDAAPLDSSFIHNNLVRGEWEEIIESPSVGPMRQLHVHMEFDDNDDAQLAMHVQNTFRTRVSGASKERVEVAAAIAGLVLACVAAVFAFLKIDAATRGQHRKTLGIALGVLLLSGACFLTLV